jgi:hypothetical protein
MSSVRRFAIFAVSLILSFRSLAQTDLDVFGENRVQFQNFVWSYYQTDRLQVYFYLGGQDIGKFTVLDGEKELTDIENVLQYQLDERIQILVYNNLYDLKQTNIGKTLDITNTGGITHIVGNKMFIAFNGDHQDLREQIREGITTILLQNMVSGGNIQEVLQNAVLLNLPVWFTAGLASYMGENWNSLLDSKLKDGILSGRYKKFTKLSDEDAQFAGHAFWFYIAQRYGENSIANILYLTRVNKNLKQGINLVIGKSLKQVTSDWYQYFYDQYSKEQIGRTQPDPNDLIKTKYRKYFVYNQVRVNADATKMAYVTNDYGRFHVVTQDLNDTKRKTVLRGGYRDNTLPVDYTFPVIAWDATGTNLAMAYTRKEKTRLILYNTDTHKRTTRDIVDFQKIVSMNFTGNPNQLVISALNKGQSDIYLYNYEASIIQPITNDFYDDLNPRYIKLADRTGIVWASNRPSDTLKVKFQDTILPLANDNIFFYNLKTKSKTLLRITNDQGANDALPSLYNHDYLSFLSDANGIYNRRIARIDSIFDHNDHYYFFADSTIINPKYNMDSLIAAQQLKLDSTQTIPVYRDTAIVYNITNKAKGILEQDVSKTGLITDMIYANGRYQFYKSHALHVDDTIKPIDAPRAAFARVALPADFSPALVLNNQPIRNATDTANHFSVQTDTNKKSSESFFQNKFTNPANRVEIDTTEMKVNSVVQKPKSFRFPRVLPYTIEFATDYLVTQLDNSVLVNRYQPFAGNGGQFQNPDLSGLIKLGITDLFEDYKIYGGFSIPTNFSGSEYFITYENDKQRLSKQFTYLRQVNLAAYDFSQTPPVFWLNPVNARQVTNLGEVKLNYPLDFTKSLRLTFAYRQDKVAYQAADTFSLHLPFYSQNWLMLHEEYVFDNTLQYQLNILNGTRFKIYSDQEKLLDASKTYLFTVGFDAREYVRIYKNLIWATRFNGETSFGQEKVIYYLGGEDNWLIPVFNTNTPIAGNENYAFQALATNLRGFDQNVRNGNSYSLVNTEIRWPIFSFLINAPIRSELIKNFQIITFLDAGTAWVGNNPFSSNNPFNTSQVTQGPITIFVNYYRNPVVYGYGFGARTSILGYFVRADYAWGVDSGAIGKPIFYLSFGTDF